MATKMTHLLIQSLWTGTQTVMYLLHRLWYMHLVEEYDMIERELGKLEWIIIIYRLGFHVSILFGMKVL